MKWCYGIKKITSNQTKSHWLLGRQSFELIIIHLQNIKS
jgi:hypothetical protein